MKKIISLTLIALVLETTCMSYRSYMDYYKNQPRPRQKVTKNITHNQISDQAADTEIQKPIQRQTIQPTVSNQSINPQPIVDTAIEQFTIDISYKNPNAYAFSPTKTISLPLSGQFTLQDLQDGIMLHTSLFAPSTSDMDTNSFSNSQQQGYLFVAMLVSNDGSIVTRTQQSIPTSTPPTNMILKYNDMQISATKQLFAPNTKLTDNQNQYFFNKKAPIHKKFYIKQTRLGVVAQ